ncbi:MAG: type II toxin-antitoxin system VapC family toxin [Halieaceae bacterium]|nr:type II toxin-antitoxin system VapC family toxin [Halieaceae bacterium]
MIVDTNALSAWAEGIASIEEPLQSADQLVVPVIVLGEYYFGIRQSRHRKRYEDWIRRYLRLVEVADVTQTTADRFAFIRLQLKRQGTPIPSNDAWIAALAYQHRLPVLSNDTHFDFVEGIARIPF